MNTFHEVIREAERSMTAIGHFNISDIVALRAIFETAHELKVPILIGTSEGEREFIGPRQAVMLVKSLREEFDYPIFINADHTHSFEKVKEAVAAGYDAILFDGGKLPFQENITQTKQVVEYVKEKAPHTVIEGELGYIGSSSEVQKELPQGAAIRPEDLTTAQQAIEFVKATHVDLLAPAVGNLHGLFTNAAKPRLDINRILEIKKAVQIPLVLHGGSGSRDEDFINAINAGISIIHINTEIRVAWRGGIEEALLKNPDEVAPYKLMGVALDKMKEVVYNRLTLFSMRKP